MAKKIDKKGKQRMVGEVTIIGTTENGDEVKIPLSALYSNALKVAIANDDSFIEMVRLLRIIIQQNNWWAPEGDEVNIEAELEEFENLDE